MMGKVRTRITAGMLVAAWAVMGYGLIVAPWLRTTFGGDVHAATYAPTFYRDVLPILQGHCQSCHRASGIAPMAFGSYEQTRPFAAAIGSATQTKSMPPWFAVPGIGHFSNDPSLTPEQIATLAAWCGGFAGFVVRASSSGAACVALAGGHHHRSLRLRAVQLCGSRTRGCRRPRACAAGSAFTREVSPAEYPLGIRHAARLSGAIGRG